MTTMRRFAPTSVSNKWGQYAPNNFKISMNKSDILNTFNKYSIFADILSSIESDEEWGEMYLNNLVAMNFKGEVDLIMYVRNH